MDLISRIFIGFAAICGTSLVAPAKILFLYPMYIPSHYRAFNPVIEELARKGHQITAYTSVPGGKSYKNFEHTSITYQRNFSAWDVLCCRSMSTIAFVHKRWNFFIEVAEAFLQTKELQALMNSQEQFDLMIVEGLYMQESLLAFAHKFKVPVIDMYPFFLEPQAAQVMGVPHSFSYIPVTQLPQTDHMNFWQRTNNLLVGTYMILVEHFYFLPKNERLMQKYFKYPGSENLPPLRELISNISLHLVLSHQLLTSVRPYTPNVIDIAGLYIKPVGELPQDLKLFLDEATDGFIYVSFGTIVSDQALPARFRDILVKTLKGVKQKVIMKWSEEIEGAQHILAKRWLPQTDILAHPNCKLFITHGGFNSLTEVMTRGVPTLGLPFFADQFHNVAYYVQQGVGLEINLEYDTVEDLTEKINRIIHTPSFMVNAKRIAALLHEEQPQSRLDNAVFWVEYVIRHEGAHHLKPASAKLPYYQYLLLDVVAFLATATVLSVYIVYICFRKVMVLFTDKKSALELKKQK